MAEALGPGLDPAQLYFKMLLGFVVFYFVFLFKIVSLKLIRKYCLSPASLPALSSSLGGDKTRTLLEPGDSPQQLPHQAQGWTSTWQGQSSGLTFSAKFRIFLMVSRFSPISCLNDLTCTL